MKFNKDLASIHAYLCADGYVITNPPSQKHKYYYIGLRNTNETLLRDFQSKFERVFGVRPIITNEGRCKIQNKEIYQKLTKNYTYYSDKWNFPKLSKNNYAAWLQSYFDCDGWARAVKGKDRKIGLDSINQKGISQIKNILKKEFKITSTVKKRNDRNIWSLTICGRDDLTKFKKHIGFLHPKKVKTLEDALNSYVDYNWKIPSNKNALKKFVRKIGRSRKSRKEVRIFSIIKRNLTLLRTNLNKFGVVSRVYGPWKNSEGRLYYCLILKKGELKKLQRG